MDISFKTETSRFKDVNDHKNEIFSIMSIA